MKHCRGCGARLIVGENWVLSRAKKKNYICKECASIEAAAYYEDHSDEIKMRINNAYAADSTLAKARVKRYRKDNPDARRDAYLRKEYGITAFEYDIMYEAQGGVCALPGCNKTVADGLGRRLAVDHDHETGAVRGLLCSAHNTAIGLCHDSPVELRALAEYLEITGAFERGNGRTRDNQLNIKRESIPTLMKV